MKYKHGGRVALANINRNSILNDKKLDTAIMEDYKYFIPTPSSEAFSNGIGLSFNENEFVGKPERIGSGFFADVYRVRHFLSDTFMAFKVPQDTEVMNRFMKEIQLLKELDHINILGFHGTCVIDGLFGCLTEYLNSGNLSSLIESHGATLEWSLGVRIAGDISNGLAYLHQKFIVHRDLSSENILLHREHNPILKYRAVIADFGLFLNLKRNRSDSLSTVGNPFYTAPENLRNLTPYNFASDVFSFGMILCEIITGLKNDPNDIPRTDNYGLNYKELKVKNDCPIWLHGLACDCCMVYVSNRPSMRRASEIIEENNKYIKLWQSAPVSEDISQKLYSSKDCMKARTMSMSVERPLFHDRIKTRKRNSRSHNASQHETDTLPSPVMVNGSIVDDQIDERPLYRYYSVDSINDPHLVNLDKASKDPGYVDRPLRTSMRQLDPRRTLPSMRHAYTYHGRSSSESDLVDRATTTQKHTTMSWHMISDVSRWTRPEDGPVVTNGDQDTCTCDHGCRRCHINDA